MAPRPFQETSIYMNIITQIVNRNFLETQGTRQTGFSTVSAQFQKLSQLQYQVFGLGTIQI